MCGKLVNRVLLGLLFLVAGLIKFWAVTQGSWQTPAFFASLNIPLATFFAWVVMLSEIIFGIAILAKYKLEYTVWPLIIIMVVAALTANLYGGQGGPNWTGMLMHLAIASNLWILGGVDKKFMTAMHSAGKK